MSEYKDYEYMGERCSNCHAGILESPNGDKKCVNNYTYCDYSKTKPIELIDFNLVENSPLDKLRLEIIELEKKINKLMKTLDDNENIGGMKNE